MKYNHSIHQKHIKGETLACLKQRASLTMRSQLEVGNERENFFSGKLS